MVHIVISKRFMKNRKPYCIEIVIQIKMLFTGNVNGIILAELIFFVNAQSSS